MTESLRYRSLTYRWVDGKKMPLPAKGCSVLVQQSDSTYEWGLYLWDLSEYQAIEIAAAMNILEAKRNEHNDAS